MDQLCINGIWLIRNNPRIIGALPVLKKSIDEDMAYRNLYSALEKSIKEDAAVNNIIELFSEIYVSLNYLLRLNEKTIFPGERERTEQVPMFNMSDIAVKQHSFLDLGPLMSALTKSEKNRLEIIREAREKKLFDDFRIYPYLDKALTDKQLEVTELVKDIIKTDLGDKISPFILSRFECNDKDENLKRFELLCELKYEELDELLKEILESNVIKLQAKVIQYISNDVAYEDLLIKLSESPQKLLREKVLFGLVNLKTEKTEKKLYELYTKAIKKKNKGDIELLIKALSQTGLLYTFDDVLSQVRGIFNSIIIADKKADAELFHSLRSGISVLKRKVRTNVYDFFLELLFHKDYNKIIGKRKYLLAQPATSVSYAIIDAIQDLDTEQLIAFYEKVIGEMEESEWKSPFYKMYLQESIRRGDSVEQIYDVFAPYYRSGNISIEDIAEMCGVNGSSQRIAGLIDNRWLDQLYETLEHAEEEDNIETLLQVLYLLEPDSSERYDQELIKAGKATKKHLLEITAMIMKRNLPDKYEIVYSLVKHCHDQGQSGSHALRQLLRATYWSEFPKAYAAKFRELKNAPKAIYTKIAENEA
jgi:hypothetical protein